MAEVIRGPKLSEQARALSSWPSPGSRRGASRTAGNSPESPAPDRASKQSDTDKRETASGSVEQSAAITESVENFAPTDEMQSEGPESVMDARAVAAEHRLHEIQEEIARERRTAVEEGRAQGYQDGMEASRKAVEEELQRLKALIQSLSGELSKRLNDSEDAMVEVVCASIVKILGEVMLTREGVVGVVKNAIAQLTQRGKLIVRVSPDDLELLQGERQTLLNGLDETSVELVPDGRVKLGGCLLETESGGLDGRLEVQLQRLNDVLLSTRSQRQTGSGI